MSKKAVKAATGTAGPAQPAVWDFLTDLSRQQLSVATEASGAVLRGLNTMRTIQERAARQASARHEAAARQLRHSCQPTDLMALQLGLLRDDMQGAAQYWQELAATALEMQTEMMGCASHLVDSDAALEAASALEAFDQLPGVASFFKPAAAVRRAQAR